MESFPSFPRLPPEVRVHIWTLALWKPNIVQLCYDSTLNFQEQSLSNDIYQQVASRLPLSQHDRAHLVSRVIPPLLHACSESRALALKVYPHRFYELDNAMVQTYANFDVDTICLTSANSPIHFAQLCWPLANPGGLDPGRVRRLAININVWNRHFPAYFFDYIASYTSLETLILFVESEDQSEEEAQLRELGEGDESALWDCSGYFVSGIGSVITSSSLEVILENIQRWRDLTQPMEGYEYLRESVFWRLPQVKLMKLEGKILRQISQAEAKKRGCFPCRK